MQGKSHIRCFIMFLVSGFFVALNVVAYLIAKGKIEPIAAFPSLMYFDAISQITMIFSKESFSQIVELFKLDWFNAVFYFSPILLFLFAAGSCINDFFKLLSGQYEKIKNVIDKALICAAVLFMCCFGLISAFRTEPRPNSDYVWEYFKMLYANDALVFTAVMVGIAGVVLAVLFALMPIRSQRQRY